MKNIYLLTLLLLMMFSCDLYQNSPESKSLETDDKQSYLGTWVYSVVNPDNTQDSETYTWTLSETSGTILESITNSEETVETEYIIKIENGNEKLKITKTKYRILPTTEYSNYTEADAEQTFDYIIDENNILFYIDDENNDNLGAILTKNEYSENNNNEEFSIIGRWGWDSYDIVFNSDGSFVFYNTSTNPETIELETNYTFSDNVLIFPEYESTIDIYIFNNLLVQDYGYGNSIYIYKKRF